MLESPAMNLTPVPDVAQDFLLLILLLILIEGRRVRVRLRVRVRQTRGSSRCTVGRLRRLSIKFQVHARVESGGTPPHSKTLARWLRGLEDPPGFGVRRRCGALDGSERSPMAGQFPSREGLGVGSGPDACAKTK